MLAVIITVITKKSIGDFDIHIAIIISGLVSLTIAYYFHKKDTPAQQTWNTKRKETMEDMFDLFEQLSRLVRVGVYSFDKQLEKNEYSKQLVNSLVSQNQERFNKIANLNSLIIKKTDQNYNYLTNKETRLFKMNADTITRYLLMRINRPENYLDEIKYLENKRTITKQISEIFDEVDSENKDFLERGIFTFHESDLKGRWENTHTY